MVETHLVYVTAELEAIVELLSTLINVAVSQNRSVKCNQHTEPIP